MVSLKKKKNIFTADLPMAKHCRARQLFTFDKDNAAFCAFDEDCHIKLIENINAEHDSDVHKRCRLLKALQENLVSFEMMTEWVDATDVPPPHAFITAY